MRATAWTAPVLPGAADCVLAWMFASMPNSHWLVVDFLAASYLDLVEEEL